MPLQADSLKELENDAYEITMLPSSLALFFGSPAWIVRIHRRVCLPRQRGRQEFTDLREGQERSYDLTTAKGGGDERQGDACQHTDGIR